MRPFSGFAVRSGGLRSNRLRKAPRRHTLHCETLEPRQMLSADGLDLAGIDTPTAFLPSAITSAIVDGGEEGDTDEKLPITPLPNSPLLDLSEEDTFNLASNPDATFTIFLDFDGHVTQDPLWDAALANTRPRFGQAFETPAFDLDGDPFSFSELELDVIQESFVQVAEDFAPFNVNVTTIAPSVADLSNTGQVPLRDEGGNLIDLVGNPLAPGEEPILLPGINLDDPDGVIDEFFGVRVAIGGSTFDWLSTPGDGVGGVALLGTFSSPLDTPAFAFVEGGIANPQSQALVVAHEVGHTLGLAHWGTFVLPEPDPELPPLSPDFQNSFPGHGFDTPTGLSWGPILGAPFNADVTQWSRGEYILAANTPNVRPRPEFDEAGNILLGDDGPLILVDGNGVPLNFFNDFDPTNDPEEMTAADLGSIILQDDLAVITSGANGITFREDDHAGTGDNFDENGVFIPGFDFSTATLLNSDFLGDVATGFGLIETNTDYDFFAFDTDGGEITIDGTPNAFGANLDVRLEVFDTDGQFIGFGAQDFDLNATFTFNAPTPGRYYVAVTGDAFVTDAEPIEVQTSGYSDYASLGRYTLTVNGDLGAPPDRFEVNDSIPEATVLAEGDFSADDLSIHVTGDEDFFQWQASADGVLNVTAEFLQSEGDIELFVLDENGEVLGQSIGSIDGESLSLPVEDGEVFFIRVVGVNGATQESYDLSIDGPGLAADEFEVNDTIDTAFPIPEEDFFAQPNFHVAGDEDFFLVQAATDSETVFSVAAGTGDIAFEVLAGTTVIAEGQPAGTGDLSATVTVNTGQLLTVRIFSPSGQAITPYQFIVDGSAAVGDRLEPNDENNPTIIDTEIAVINNISIHTTTDTDFFSFTAPSNGTLNVNANFQDVFGDLDLQIIDTSIGEQIALGSSITDNESLTVPVEAGVTYLIETFGFQGVLVPVYGLSTEFIASPPVAGDATGDGIVDRDDYDVWVQTFGQTGDDLPADFNGNNVVDAADYTVWRDAFAAAIAASNATPSAAAVTTASNGLTQGGGHGPGCGCASCCGQRSGALAHDHNGDGIPDHAAHDHSGLLLYPGVALPILSEPRLPPDRSSARVAPEQPLELTQPAFVEAEPTDAPLSPAVVFAAPGPEAAAPSPASVGDAAPATPTSDLALLLLESGFADESEEDAFSGFAEDEQPEDQARDDAFALVGDLL